MESFFFFLSTPFHALAICRPRNHSQTDSVDSVVTERILAVSWTTAIKQEQPELNFDFVTLTFCFRLFIDYSTPIVPFTP